MEKDDVNEELMNKLNINQIPIIYQLTNSSLETSVVRSD